jgi:S-(hydroxymethyl)glutathione dehydrogenase/alcohol dehydrogenase
LTRSALASRGGEAGREIGVNIVNAIGGQRRIQGVNFGSANFERDTPMYAELYLQSRTNLSALVSRTIALRDVSDGYIELRGGSLNRVAVTSFE